MHSKEVTPFAHMSKLEYRNRVHQQVISNSDWPVEYHRMAQGTICPIKHDSPRTNMLEKRATLDPLLHAGRVP